MHKLLYFQVHTQAQVVFTFMGITAQFLLQPRLIDSLKFLLQCFYFQIKPPVLNPLKG